MVRRFLYFQTMSEDQLNGFLEALKSDSELKQKLKSAKTPEDVVAIAKSAGFTFSVDLVERPEVSETELEAIAGGGDS